MLVLLSDEELVVLATLGSIPAFDQLVVRYRSAITLVAMEIVKCRAVAEEVAQESFLLAFDALPKLDDPARFGGWLRSIARNRALRSISTAASQRNQPLEDHLSLVLEQSDALADPADLLERRIEEALVTDALCELSAADREVLYLYAYEDWSTAEIAHYLQLPDATVRGRLFRARQRLRGKLKQTEEIND